jgi:hypothetical protein
MDVGRLSNLAELGADEPQLSKLLSVTNSGLLWFWIVMHAEETLISAAQTSELV